MSSRLMIGIIVPTKNRSDFLIRLLRYYSDVDFRGCIYIGDSSNPPHIERSKRAIESFQGKLNIVYREFPNLNDYECVPELLKLVSTPYAAYNADDDFFVPTALEQCALFLEGHPDYSAAHGLAAVVGLGSAGAHGQVAMVSRYWQRAISGESALQRLLDHLNSYSVALFSVHRIETWRLMYKKISLTKDRALGGELLPGCLSVIQGKVEQLNCFYLVRQVHDRRHLLPDPYDWITSTDWPSSYQIFRDCLADELARRDGLSVEEAREVVKRAFWSYLAPGLMRTWQARYAQNGRGLPSRWRELAKRVPGVRKAWHTIRSSLPRRDDEMSLKRLLNPSSPYHGDFLPIYRAITTPPRD